MPRENAFTLCPVCRIGKKKTNLRPRRLFHDSSAANSSTSGNVPADIPVEKVADAATIAAFRARWGYDIIKDCPVDDGNWKYELIEEKALPEDADQKEKDADQKEKDAEDK